MADTTRDPITPIRLTAHDRACIDLLRSQLSLGTIAAVVRQGVRALAAKEGVALPPPQVETANGTGTTRRPARKNPKKKRKTA